MHRCADAIADVMEQLIDDITLYRITGTANPSGRSYFESVAKETSALDSRNRRIEVPTGLAVYPRELLQTPLALAEKHCNIVYWSEQ